MQREIGSNFWLDPHESMEDKPIGTPAQFGCNGSDYVWLSTGRSAIRYVIETCEKRGLRYGKTALLPPFTCHTVIEPFLAAGYIVNYYPVNDSLQASAEDILTSIKKNEVSIVIYHRYYGFDTLPNIQLVCDELKSRGIYTIEDCTQCLYSSFEKSDADYYVGSIRKWTGTPDGGFAVCHTSLFESKPQRADVDLEKAKVRASYAKYKYLYEGKGEKNDFLMAYREAEDILGAQKIFYKISHTSEIVQSNLSPVELKKARRNNFKRLLKCLSEIGDVRPLFREIDDNTVPLYFPVFIDDRKSLQAFLAQHSIFAPVVWPKPECIGNVCEDADMAYDHLLCIPIDQRYGRDDMERISKTINNFYKQ